MVVEGRVCGVRGLRRLLRAEVCGLGFPTRYFVFCFLLMLIWADTLSASAVSRSQFGVLFLAFFSSCPFVPLPRIQVC